MRAAWCSVPATAHTPREPPERQEQRGRKRTSPPTKHLAPTPREVRCCSPACAPRKREPSLLLHPALALSSSLSPQTALPDSDGLQTALLAIATPKERLLHGHLDHNWLQPPCLIGDDRLATAGRVQPVAYFPNRNEIKCTMSKLPEEEKYPIPILSSAFFPNLHKNVRAPLEWPVLSFRSFGIGYFPLA